LGDVRPFPGDPTTRCEGDPARARHDGISVRTDARGDAGFVGGECGMAVAYEPDDWEATSFDCCWIGALNDDGGGGAEVAGVGVS
jgi:hypothetical protein